MSDMNPTPEFEEKVRKAMNVPDANPAFVNKLRYELVRRPEKVKPRFIFRPAWAVAFVLVVAVLLISVPGVAAAIGRLFGYVPGVGLVENTGNLRMLSEPVALTRDGVTLTIDSVYAYEDRVEVAYSVTGIAAQNDGTQADDATTNPTAFCGGVKVGETANTNGDARLKLPDGTILERESTGLYPKNVYAMTPVYKAVVPADVTEMTLVLKCIPWARLGAVPENWEMPFHLVSVPAGTVVGNPVIEVEQPAVQPTIETSATPSTEEPALPSPVVKMTIEKIVPMESATIVYFSMDMENRDPSLVSIMPASVYMIDSQGHKIEMRGNFAWQPFEHRVGSLFEYMSASKPADGPLTVVVENAVAYYAPLFVDPPQTTPEEMSFTFDAGENPQQGQTWDLNNEFAIAGYQLRVSSARAVTFEEVMAPDLFGNSQGYDFGYQFAVESNPATKMSVWMDIMSESPDCFLSNVLFDKSPIPSNSVIPFTQFCRDAYPKGLVKVTIGELSVLLEGIWQSTWNP